MSKPDAPSSCCSSAAVSAGKRVKLVRLAPPSAGVAGALSPARAPLISPETVNPRVRKATTDYTWRDRLGNWLVRWNFGRMRHLVEPGLYEIGTPDERSPILVTANYTFSFDMVRRELAGIDARILVLDTKGVNVWCAAGKGTFSTAEVIRRIEATGLARITPHRTLILPQLGAPGVAAHEVFKATGFRVVYGPVRANDLPAFLRDGMKATPEMREVTFTFRERLAVVPVELVSTWTYVLGFLGLFLALDLILGRLSGALLVRQMVPLVGAVLAGTVALPLLLPVLPATSFTLKGILIGGLWGAFVALLFGMSTIHLVGTIFLCGAIAGVLGLNFTGCTPITSQSGVQYEIDRYFKPMAVMGILGLIIEIAGLALGGMS